MNFKKILYYGTTAILIASFAVCILLNGMIMNYYEKKLNNEVNAIFDYRPAQKIADITTSIIILGTVIATIFIRMINKKAVPKSKRYIVDKIVYGILLAFLILALPIMKHIYILVL